MTFRWRLARRLFAVTLAFCIAGGAQDTQSAEKPRFTDVTAQTNLRIAENTGVGGTNPHAVAVEDFNGDGLFDIVIGTFGAPHVRYFRNLGDLRFADVTRGSGLETFSGEGTGAAVADFNHDGRLDLFLASLRGGSSRLYQGRGDGTFVDATESAGVLIDASARSCAWSDVDRDSHVDLFIACPDGPNRLYRNQGDGTFVDIAVAAGVALPDRHNLGCAFADVDLDGRDDLFVTSYVSQQSVLFRNLSDSGIRSSVKFEDISALAALNRKASAVGCAWADIFNQGHFDLYVTTDSWLSGANSTEPELRQQGHTVEPSLLYRFDGRKPSAPRFEPVAGLPSEHKSLSHDITLEDLDHDGLCEIYVGVDAIPTGNIYATSKGGNPLWTRTEDAPATGLGIDPSVTRTWRNVGRAWGVDFEANCVCVPAADFDNDGDLDLLLINFYDNVVLYRNNTDDRQWLRIKAVGGAKSNPDALGAKVRVFADREGQSRLIGLRQIQSGTGYARCSPLEAHFGLGSTADRTFSVEVQFPSGVRLSRKQVQPGQRLVIREVE